MMLVRVIGGVLATMFQHAHGYSPCSWNVLCQAMVPHRELKQEQADQEFQLMLMLLPKVAALCMMSMPMLHMQ